MWADPRPSKGIVTAQCGAPHETGNLDIEVLRAFAIGGVILHHLSDTLLARQHGSLNWLMQHVDYWTGELNWRLLETPTRRYGAYLAQTFRNRRDHARQEFSYVPNHT